MHPGRRSGEAGPVRDRLHGATCTRPYCGGMTIHAPRRVFVIAPLLALVLAWGGDASRQAASEGLPEPVVRGGRAPTATAARQATPLSRAERWSFEERGARFDVRVSAGQRLATRAGITHWLRSAARTVAGLFGRFPVPHVFVTVEVKGPSRNPVPFGEAIRRGDERLRLLLSANAKNEDLPGEWVAIHEMIHLGMPWIHRGDNWINEGFVTYYQEVLRTRAGFQTESEGWMEIWKGFLRGQSVGGRMPLEQESLNMHKTHAYWRVYWGGAAMALEMDLAIRAATKGRRSLDDVIRLWWRAFANERRTYRGRELLAAADRWLGQPFCLPLAERRLPDAKFPDVGALFARMGMQEVDGRLRLLPPRAPGRRARPDHAPRGPVAEGCGSPTPFSRNLRSVRSRRALQGAETRSRGRQHMVCCHRRPAGRFHLPASPSLRPRYPPRMRLDELDFELPPDRIAQVPAVARESARLLVVGARQGVLAHASIADLASWLAPGDLLVLNDTRVLAARLAARRPTGGRAEVFFLEPMAHTPGEVATDGGASGDWQALVRAKGSVQVGERLVCTADPAHASVVLVAPMGEGVWRVRPSVPATALMQACGVMPLPPYIRREPGDPREALDRARYQTTYARVPGAVAAPTAGLHLTRDALRALTAKDVAHAFVTLHVGRGTFAPVRAEDLDVHPMHEERYTVPAATVEAVSAVRAAGGRVVAVGTTTVRALESAAASGTLLAQSGSTDLLIQPGYAFRVVDALLTNFHLPRSTLLALVMALAGKDVTRDAYREAIAQRYRFYSYGDAMLILPRGAPGTPCS